MLENTESNCISVNSVQVSISLIQWLPVNLHLITQFLHVLLKIFIEKLVAHVIQWLPVNLHLIA